MEGLSRPREELGGSLYQGCHPWSSSSLGIRGWITHSPGPQELTLRKGIGVGQGCDQHSGQVHCTQWEGWQTCQPLRHVTLGGTLGSPSQLAVPVKPRVKEHRALFKCHFENALTLSGSSSAYLPGKWVSTHLFTHSSGWESGAICAYSCPGGTSAANTPGWTGGEAQPAKGREEGPTFKLNLKTGAGFPFV